MRGIRFVAAVGLMLALVSAARAEDKPAADQPKAEPAKVEKSDAERIVGTWKFDSADGPFDLLKDAGHTAQLKFEDTGKFQFKVLADGGPILQISADYALDDKQTPKLLDLTLTGDGGGNQVFAIYEFQNDKLRVRFRTEGATARPADFAVPDEGCRILTFVREKDAK